MPTTKATGHVTQPGGAGTPLQIQKSVAFGYVIWGHYTKPVAAADNAFVYTGTATNAAGEVASTTSIFTLANVVSDQVGDVRLSTNPISEVLPIGYVADELVKDDRAADGTLLSADNNYDRMAGSRSFRTMNDGNQTETNVTMSIDLEPGTENADGYTITNTDFAPLTKVTFTYADGTTQEVTGDAVNDTRPVSFKPDQDATNVVNITANWATLNPGQAVMVEYSGDNSLLTDKQAGDTLTYKVNVTSDQVAATSVTDTKTLIAPKLKANYVRPYGEYGLSGLTVRPGDVIGADNSIYVSLYYVLTGQPLGTYYVTAPEQMSFTEAKLNSTPVTLVATGMKNTNGQAIYKIDLSKVLIPDTTQTLYFTYRVNASAVPATVSGNSYSELVFQGSSDVYTDPLVQNTTLTFGDKTVEATTKDSGATINGNRQNAYYPNYSYQILLPSYFKGQDGIDDPMSADTDYLKYDAANAATTTAVFSRGATTATTDDINASNIQLATINTTNLSSPWTQNVINLPAKSEDDAFTLALTDAAILSGVSAKDATVYYSTSRISVGNTKIAVDNLLTADQVTDWSQIKAVLLNTDDLAENDVALATLPVAVVDINDVPNQTMVQFDGKFLGEQEGKVVVFDDPMAAKVVQTAPVTTTWTQKLPDGSTVALQDPITTNFALGETYTTSPLAAINIPTGYELQATPANASGTVTTSDAINVDYVYVGQPQTVNVHYIDVNASAKTSGWKPTDGTEIAAAKQTLTGTTGANYTNTLAQVTNYVLAGTKSYDAGAESGVYDNKKDVAQDYYVYLKHETTKATPTNPGTYADKVSKTVTQTVNFIDKNDQSPVATPNVQTVTFVRELTIDKVTDAVVSDSDWTVLSGKANFAAVAPASAPDYVLDQALSDAVDVPATTVTADTADRVVNMYYGHLTRTETEHKVVDETITYVYAQGGTASKPHADQVSFTRTATTDEVTQAITYTPWVATDSDTTFDAVTSPVITGHIADHKVVAAVTGLKNTDEPVTVQVTYSKLGSWTFNRPNVPDVTYPNDPSDPSQPAAPGTPGYPVIPAVPGYTPLTDDGTPLQPVDPDDETKGYLPPAPTDPTEDTPITYTADKQVGQVAYIDDTTGDTLHTDPLSGDSETVATYTTADWIAAYQKQGYTLVSDNFPTKGLTFDDDDTQPQDFEVHLNEKIVGPTTPGEGDADYDQTHKRFTVTVTATSPDGSDVTPTNAVQVFHFERTQTVNLVTKETTYGDWEEADDDPAMATVTAVPVANYTATLTNQAGEIDADNQLTATDVIAAVGAFMVANDTTDGSYTANFKYCQTTFTPEQPGDEPGTTLADLTKTVTENVVYNAPVSQRADAVEVHTFYRTATVDATGKLTGYSDWTTNTDGVSKDANDRSVTIAALTDLKVPSANYQATVATTDTANKTTADNVALTIAGGTDDADMVVTRVVSYTGTFTPGEPGTDAKTNLEALTKKLTETITFHNPDKTITTVAGPEQTFYRTAAVDQAGSVTYGAWTTDPDGDATKGADDATVAAIAATELARTGYTAAVTNAVAGVAQADGNIALTVAATTNGDGDIAVTRDVTYQIDAQTITVTYIDDFAQQQLTKQTLNGVSNADSHYDVATAIADYEARGYSLVTNDAPSGSLIFDDDATAEQAYTVHLTHALVPATPATPTPLTGGADYTNNVQKTITETITYINDDGSNAPQPYEDSITFTRQITVDKVTGLIVANGKFTTDWAAVDNKATFAEVVSPQQLGYVADKYNVPAATVTQDSADIEEVVHYRSVPSELEGGIHVKTKVQTPEPLKVERKDYYNNLTPGEVGEGIHVKTKVQTPEPLSVKPEDYYNNLTPGEVGDGVQVKTQVPDGASVTPEDYYNNLTPGEVGEGIHVKTKVQTPEPLSVTPEDYYNNLTPGEVDEGIHVKTKVQTPEPLSVTPEDYYDNLTPGEVGEGIHVKTKVQTPEPLSVTPEDYYDNLTPGEVDDGVQVKTQVPDGASATPEDYDNNQTPAGDQPADHQRPQLPNTDAETPITDVPATATVTGTETNGKATGTTKTTVVVPGNGSDVRTKLADTNAGSGRTTLPETGDAQANHLGMAGALLAMVVLVGGLFTTKRKRG